MLLNEFEYALKVREISPRTISTYVNIARRLTEYCYNNYSADFEHDTVTGLMISHWAGSIADLKPTSRKLYHTGAEQFLKFLFDTGSIAKDLTKSIPDIGSLESLYKKYPELKPDKQPYTIEQVQEMLKTPSRSREVTLRNHALIAVLVSTGLRIFEALQLNVGDIYGGNPVKVARKGSFGNLVEIVIPAQVRQYVDPYIEYRRNKPEDVTPESPLFADNRGDRLTKRNAHATIAELEKKLGLPTGLHTFRHTALTITSKVADPVVARDFAGQKNLSVTNRYLHTSTDELKTAADMVADRLLNPEPKAEPEPDLAAQLAAAQALVASLQAQMQAK